MCRERSGDGQGLETGDPLAGGAPSVMGRGHSLLKCVGVQEVWRSAQEACEVSGRSLGDHGKTVFPIGGWAGLVREN